MNEREQEEETLRLAALQTSKSILLARQRTEQELARSLALMRATLEATTDGILVTDGLGKITNFNEKYAMMWAMPREILEAGDDNRRKEFASRQFADPQKHLARIREIESSALAESFDLLEFKDQKVFERYSRPLASDDPNLGRVWSFRDITQRKQLEDNLLAAKVEAESANKAKDDFLAALSHELRTPLTPVLMMATALREEASLSPEVREHLAMMERNIALEVRLIDDLLDITAVSRGKLRLRPQACDAHSLIGLAIEIVRDEALTKEITIEREFSALHSGLVIDPARFQQVVWNLLRNAVKFTPRGGRIAIRTRDDDADWLHIEITDSGIGIEPAVLEKIFLPFEQAAVGGDHRFGGLGLGLAIARAIVSLHGGKIRATSTGANHGATFTVEFPGATNPPHGITDHAPLHLPLLPTHSDAAKTEAPKPGLRLLLVEDHAPTLQVISALLTRTGYHVVTAGNNAEALAAAAANKFDLVISDLGLPDGSGIHLMEKLRDQHGLRGIAISGYGMEEDIARSYQAGFVEHLVKPVAIAELRRVLAKLDPSLLQKENPA